MRRRRVRRHGHGGVRTYIRIECALADDRACVVRCIDDRCEVSVECVHPAETAGAALRRMVSKLAAAGAVADSVLSDSCVAYRHVQPSPVAVRGGDELSCLAIAFNDMTGRLCEQRRQLLRVNEDLERCVEKRMAQLAEAAARLAELASRDVLTSLPNRYAMMSALEEMFRASREAGVDLMCLAIDLDGFKGVNDTLGHAAGDELLKIAGDLFKEVCREGDVPARLGGDEFIILLPMRQPRDAEPIANRLLENFGAHAQTWLDGRCVPAMPSLSVGIATIEHSGAASPEELLSAADEALYIAKRAGKGRYEFWRKPGDGKASSEAA